MKKLLLLLLFIPLVSISQNDFRKMDWGESPKILKEKYSEISFIKESEGDMTVLSHSEFVGGIEATVAYTFTNDKLFAAGYLFSMNSYSKNAIDHLKDFDSVSQRLNDKYEMEREDVWLNDSWKDDSNYLSHALSMAHVSLIERGINNNTIISHSLEKTEGKLLHRLLYSSVEMMQNIQDSIDDDF